MSDESRANILSRIRAANNASSEEREREWNNLPRQYRQKSSLDEAGCVQLFDERIRHYNGTPFYSSGDIQVDLANILGERNKRKIVIPPAFPTEWLPGGIECIRDENLSKQQLNEIDGVLTTCTLGIALTGTVVLESSPEQGRRAITLIPDYHLCVLRTRDIVEFVPEAIRRLEPVKHRPLTFFSGPSATVDIEMTRVRGVHGPRTLDILLI